MTTSQVSTREPMAESTPETAQRPSPAATLAQVRRDSQSQPQQYLEETVVRFGGE